MHRSFRYRKTLRMAPTLLSMFAPSSWLRGGLKPEPNGMIREILIPDTCLPLQDDLIQIHCQMQSVSAFCEKKIFRLAARDDER